MAHDIVLYNNCLGLNNVDDPARLVIAKGQSTLEDCRDIEIDHTGAIVSALDVKKLAEGAYHSMFPLGDNFFIAEDREADTALFFIQTNANGITKQGIRSALTQGARISYTLLGSNVFYCNGFENGILALNEGQ
ncbi:hypothetical protein [Desulfotalea psychrophila]|uniref:Uncharacterized protein n=1 Tax=Desulfotalea psychrophila (strain LSv54 / DSM 12343) TaxID=177439 RepID=Q6ALP7_DESPS|nr:hypothetical protein [Desulfotalea psychrophila]CAG36728.1 unknown protein [Desulfotalea psychrophila LSv54]